MLLALPVLAALTACIASAPLSESDKFALNEQFNALEEAYWPKPVRLQGENVLVISYKSWAFCDDVCNEILDGQSGARVYYAQYDHPQAPDFRDQVNLRAIAQGRLQRTPNTHYDVTYTPFRPGEEKPTFEHVLIAMREPITPVLTQVLPQFDLRPNHGDAWLIFAPVVDDRAYQLTAQGAHFIDFGRDAKTFGEYNSWHNTYHFPNGTDADAKQVAIENMVCGPQATDRRGCAR